MAIFSQRSREGYLMIDHRASPGIGAADVAKFRSLGFNIPEVPEGTMRELGTKACAHCGGVVVLNPDRVRERGHCSKCFKYLCDPCAALGDCRPIQALADLVMGSDKHLPPTSPLILRS